jgi:uncharacterized membrane protein YhaH (DUF805 family)
MTRWNTTYAELSHANEEVISDNIRKAHWVVAVAWLLLIVALGIAEYGKDTPSIGSFLYNSLIATICVGVFYSILVGLRYYAHRRPDQWHTLNWTIVWIFLASVTIYYIVNEGWALDSIMTASVLISVVIYHQAMHYAKITWEITPKGVSERITFLGYTHSAHTEWKDVRRHWVHPLTGAVQLRLGWHGLHARPHVHLIVPGKHRKEVHELLSKILKVSPKHRPHHILT